MNSGSFSLNNVVVRNVTDSNYTKFTLNDSTYQLSKSSSNMIVDYKHYSVSYNLTNCTQSGGGSYVTVQSNLSFTLSANSGYVLPGSITVVVGSTTLTKDTHYTYNSSTGAVVVYKEYFNASVTITVNAIQQITLRFFNTSGEAVFDTVVITKNSSYTLPTIAQLYNVPRYYSTVTWFFNQSLTGSGYGGGYTIQAVSASQDFYLKLGQTNSDVVDQFVGVQLHFDVDVVSLENENDTGACRGDTGYYKAAKEVYLDLSAACKTIFRTYDAYENARARFTAWATANHEVINYSTGAISSSGSNINFVDENKDNTMIIVIASISVLVVLGAFILNKKHAK